MTDASDDDANSAGGPAANPVGLIGKTLGRYHLTAELGRGGMATVYRASDPQLGREVAVKVMHGTFAGRGDIEKRFRREAQAVAAIKHDSILDIFDFAPGARGEPGYIVTEIIDGPTLRELMDECGGRILPEVAALLAARVAGALGAAHKHGIVHRDVKPDNVMIERRPGAPVRVVLTDFGVAHIIADDTMTATGSLLGSPAYMSPEQARGQEVGPHSDVFSLGVLLYHMVAGRTPFVGKDPLTMIAAILHGELLRPSQVDAHVGAPLEAIILRCLNRAPAERYPDASAVFVALNALAEEAGLTDEAASLRAFFDDRETLLAALRRRIAEQAFAQARKSARRGDLTRALSEVNRVFAYHPNHSGAEALLTSIASRRRWTKVAMAAAGVVILGAGGYATRRLIADGALSAVETPAPSTTSAAAPPRQEPAPPPPALPTVAPPPTLAAAETPPPSSPSPPVQPGAAAKAGNLRRPRTRVPEATERSAAVSARPTPADAPLLPTNPAPVAVVREPPAPVPAAVPVPALVTPTASLTIRASQGFCSPSMDDHPAKIRPVYEGVAPGVHRIYCTLPGGEKHLVGSYDLRPGTRPNLAIIPGPGGKPVLARPE
ncbi:MAG TPA: serine/threonine-protein kinase [Polyangia bacterium]|nr:serine/threonine-protein kinase [Polyangia bacterium]